MGRCEIGNARVYITTRQKCGQGIRLGKWLELKGYASKKDLLNSFRELYKDETEPVICYLDWQDIPPGFISETDISKNLFGLINGFKELTPTDKIGFSIWLGNHQDAIPDVRADKIIKAFKGCYQGYFAYKQRFTEYYAREELGITKKESPRFDFITFNKYLFTDLFVIDSGFVFLKIKYEVKETDNKGISPKY